MHFVRGNHEEYSRYEEGIGYVPFFSDYERTIVPGFFSKC